MQKEDVSEYKMINVGSKIPTTRTCLASGKLIAAPSTIAKIRDGGLPKGNVLPLAEAAGIMALKKTSDTLPLCHPIGIDAATIRFQFEEHFVKVICETTAFAKTGVEMEALCGVSAALLCIYDLAKGVDPALEISEVRLIRKEGGKSGIWNHPQEKIASEESKPLWSGVNFSVVTLSDRCSQGKAVDTSGPAMVEFGKKQGANFLLQVLIPDDAIQLKSVIYSLCEDPQTHLILCTGGTGLGPRDLTPETIASMGGKLIPGFGELIRERGANFTAHSWLSRAEAYLLKNRVIVCLPGSRKAVEESLAAIASLIPHAVEMAEGKDHR